MAATSAPFPLLQDHFITQGVTTKKTPPSVEGESPMLNPLQQSTSDPHWKFMLPSANTLRMGPFGKQDTNHSFMQEALLDMIAFFAILSGFLMVNDLHNLTTAHPLLQQLQDTITMLADYYYRWIKTANQNWATQMKVNPDKTTAFLTCLFYYNIDTSLVMHYLGGNYTRVHRNVDDIIPRILPYVDSKLLHHYRRVMTTGCPNFSMQISYRRAS